MEKRKKLSEVVLGEVESKKSTINPINLLWAIPLTFIMAAGAFWLAGLICKVVYLLFIHGFNVI